MSSILRYRGDKSVLMRRFHGLPEAKGVSERREVVGATVTISRHVPISSLIQTEVEWKCTSD